MLKLLLQESASSHGVFPGKFPVLKYPTDTTNQKEIKLSKIKMIMIIPKWHIQFLFKIILNCHLNHILILCKWKCLCTCSIICQTINTVFPFARAPVSCINVQIYWKKNYLTHQFLYKIDFLEYHSILSTFPLTMFMASE